MKTLSKLLENMLQKNSSYLIIAQSGRALAAAANRGGACVHVIDHFADQDTKRYAQSTRKLSEFNLVQQQSNLIALVKKYVWQYPSIEIVLGSGFESKPQLQLQLQRIAPVIANNTQCIQQIKDPAIFYPLLQALSLPHPIYHLRDHPDTLTSPYLIKAIGASGGSHISPYKQGGVPKNHYLQQQLYGRHYSVTFIADGRAFQLLGFNEIWQRTENSNFTFSGMVSNSPLAEKYQQKILTALKKLVALFRLHGLCSMDFIITSAQQYYLIEINPRPSASFELYDNNNDLFARHVLACQGKLTVMPPQTKNAKALQIIYAEKDMVIADLPWQEWVSDRPSAGVKIMKNAPVCTIHASGITAMHAKKQLHIRCSHAMHQVKKVA